jgi:hypothetical protein
VVVAVVTWARFGKLLRFAAGLRALLGRVVVVGFHFDLLAS